MFPFKTNIYIDRTSQRAIYLQLCDQIIGLIKSGKLPRGSKLPGSRTMAEDLQIHRKTVVAAYEELALQGWIETIAAKGTFVQKKLPIVQPTSIVDHTQDFYQEKSTFSFSKLPNIDFKKKIIVQTNKNTIKIDDGVPDNRLAPIDEIAKVYRNITKKKYHKELLGYNSIYGNLELRKALVSYLHQTRGMQISTENILITRGSQMGIYLSSQLILNQGGYIVVGNTNYIAASHTFSQAGVSAERRMHLLQLAQKYHFAIIEDDYDYDFHYNHAPILPLASNDSKGNVVYIGGFTKSVAPAIRIGYLIAPKDFVQEAAQARRIIDRQGDMVLEQALAQMIHTGDVQRHCSKALKVYKRRRDFFCELLQKKLSEYFEFQIPQGGMAVWVKLRKKYNWETVMAKCAAQDLIFINNWKRYDTNNSGHNGIRMGFASHNEEELLAIISRLETVLKTLK